MKALYRVVTPLFWSDEFPDYPWTMPVHKSVSDWEEHCYEGTAGTLKVGDTFVILATIDGFCYIQTTNSAIVGWIKKHALSECQKENDSAAQCQNND